MSGGSFGYAYSKVDDFVEQLHERLARAASSEDNTEGVGGIDLATARKLEEIVQYVDKAGKLMKEVEWYFSGDNGDESFLRNVRDIEAAKP